MNNLDKYIKQKLDSREITPSESAWERLAVQLDDKERKINRRKFWYVSYAASILILISLFFMQKNKNTNFDELPTNDVYVNQSTDTSTFKHKEIEFHNNLKEVIADKNLDKRELQKKSTPNQKADYNKTHNELSENLKVIATSKNNLVEPKQLKNQIIKEKDVKSKKPKVDINSITVDSDALLYAVTHEKEAVKQYYKKYLISRNEVLKVVKEELKNHPIKVDAESILAEVETDLSEQTFKKNFLQFVKKRVSDLATVIATRNE